MNLLSTPSEIRRISKIRNFHHDEYLKQEILTILAQSYSDPEPLLNRAYANNEVIYTCRDQDENLIGFYMAGRAVLGDTTVVYLGLSGVRNEKKGQGIGKMLYKYHRAELQVVAYHTGNRILCWATTASFAVFKAFRDVFGIWVPGDGLPCETGAFDILRLICEGKGWKFDERCPFLVKGCAPRTRYTSAETDRLKKFAEKESFTYFDQIGLNQQSGDRLIMLFEISGSKP